MIGERRDTMTGDGDDAGTHVIGRFDPGDKQHVPRTTSRTEAGSAKASRMNSGGGCCSIVTGMDIWLVKDFVIIWLSFPRSCISKEEDSGTTDLRELI